MARSTQARLFSFAPDIGGASYTDGQLIWQPQAFSTEAVFQKGRIAQLQSLTGVLGDNVAPALDLLFFNAEVDLGTVAAAVDVTAAAVAAALVGVQPIVAGDWRTLKASTSKLLDVAAVRPLMLEAAEASRTLYVAGVARGSATLTADSLTLGIGVKWW